MLSLQNNIIFKELQLAVTKRSRKSPNAVVIKLKEQHRISSQQFEICTRILSKLVRKKYGALLKTIYSQLSNYTKNRSLHINLHGVSRNQYFHYYAIRKLIRKNEVSLTLLACLFIPTKQSLALILEKYKIVISS